MFILGFHREYTYKKGSVMSFENYKMQSGYDTTNSGLGSNSTVPDSVAQKFNWGAFLLTWIWGVGNYTYITLVFLAIQFLIPLLITISIPYITITSEPLFCIISVGSVIIALLLLLIGLSILFGIKGNKWAWQNKHFENIQAFHEYQKKWAIAGIIVLLYLSILFLMPVLLPVLMNGRHV